MPHHKEDQHELLQTTLSNVVYQNRMSLCGDSNGHICCDRMQYEGILGIHSIGNRNEEKKTKLRFFSGKQSLHYVYFLRAQRKSKVALVSKGVSSGKNTLKNL